MDRLTGFFTGLESFRFSNGGTFVDRLHYKYTPMVIGAFGVALMALQFIGDFWIHCWCPAHFTDSMVEYANRRCWTTRTYHVPFSSSDIPREERDREYISYYQWVIPIMFTQCLILYIPTQIWRFFCNCSGYQVSLIIAKSFKYNSTNKDEKKCEIMKDISDRFRRTKSVKVKFIPKSLGQYLNRYFLFLTYLVVKMLYLLDTLLVIYFTDRVLGGSTLSNLYVIRHIKNVFETGIWAESVRFPLVTLCDFPVRALNQIQVHTLQCTIPLNLYHDRMFVVMWFWFVLLLVIDLVSLLSWFMLSIITIAKNKRVTSRSPNNNHVVLRNSQPTSAVEKIDDGKVELLLSSMSGVENASDDRNDEVNKKYIRNNYDDAANVMFIYEMIKSNVGTFTATAFVRALCKKNTEDIVGSQGAQASGENNKGSSWN